MAKIHRERKKCGRWYYRLAVCVNGKRKRFVLGFGIAKTAQQRLVYLASELESLVAVGQRIPPELRKQVDLLNDGLRQQFVKAGLLGENIPSLSVFFSDFIEKKKSIKPDYAYKLKNTANHFETFFAAKSPEIQSVSDVTAADAHDYVEYRRSLGIKQTTISTEVKIGRHFFKYAMKKGYLTENPFAEEKVCSQVDRERIKVIDVGIINSVIESAPSNEWSILIAILRWTGCRIGEALRLRWTDVQADSNRIRIPQPKGERYGSSHRITPYWNELRAILEPARATVSDHSEYIIHSLVTDEQREGRPGKNLGQPFQAIIKLAGFEPWDKPFQNIRVTRENELERRGFAPHLIRLWIGHSQKVAEKHYLTDSEKDYVDALSKPSGQGVGSKSEQTTANRANKEASPIEMTEIPLSAVLCSWLQKDKATLLGLEPRMAGPKPAVLPITP